MSPKPMYFMKYIFTLIDSSAIYIYMYKWASHRPQTGAALGAIFNGARVLNAREIQYIIVPKVEIYAGPVPKFTRRPA